MTLPKPPPVLEFIVQHLTSVQSLINFATTTQAHLMASPTHLPTAPISSEGSTVLLSPDRYPLPGSADHVGHTPTVSDSPGSPSHLGPAGSPTTVTGSPDRRPTRPSSPARDLSPRLPDHGRYTPIVPDRPEFFDYSGPAGSLSILVNASMIKTLSTGESRGAIIPVVSTAVDPPRVSAKDVRTTLATIIYLWDREVTFSSQTDTIHALQQSLREAVVRGDRLQEQIDSFRRSSAPFVSFVQRQYDVMQGQYVNTAHSLIECKLSLTTTQDQSPQILHLQELLQAEDRDRANLEQQIINLEGQVRSLQADLNKLRRQHDQLASSKYFLETEVSNLKREFGQSQEAVEDGLASISDLIEQVNYLTPLEGQRHIHRWRMSTSVVNSRNTPRYTTC